MTTATLTPSHSHTEPGHVNFARVLRSEWIKLRTLRSTVWCYGIILLLTIGFGILLALTFSRSTGAPLSVDSQKSFAVMTATLGVNFTQLVAAVLGVLIITGEYTTGMIRSTFSAVPRRLPAFFAKVLVLAVTTFVVGLVAILVTALITAPILSNKGIATHVFDGDVLLPLIGGAGYLTLIAVLAYGLGSILRSSAGGIATALGLVLVIPPVLRIISNLTHATWVSNVSAFLPSEAGGKIFSYVGSSVQKTAPGVVDLTGLEGLLVLLAWVVAALVVGAVLIKRRDA